MSLLTNLNGTIAPTANISVLDRGFLYGDSVYEVVRTYQGKLFGLQEHLDRLRQSAAYLYLEIPWTDAEIHQQVKLTLEQADWLESYVRIVVSRGTEARISLQPSAQLKPNLLIVISEIDPTPELSQTGHRLVIPQRLRNDQRALDPAAKTGNYLNNILALLEAQTLGADDALLLNHEGFITEATTSNVWIIKAGTVYTPVKDVGILHGITRDFIFKILQKNQIPYQEVYLKPDELVDLDEAFLSSSVRLIMPVTYINHQTIAKTPGPITQVIWREFLALMAQATTDSEDC